MNVQWLPWSGQRLQTFCRIGALYPTISTSTKKSVHLLVAFNAMFETGKVIISDLKVHIRKSPVISGEFQVVGVVV
jgi:hypothetical protein